MADSGSSDFRRGSLPRVPLFLPLDVLFLDATHGALTAETALTTFNPVSRLACETYTFI